MKQLKKTLLLIVIVFALRSFSGCVNCDCSDYAEPFDYSNIRIANLDNSQTYVHETHYNTMGRKAVAFNISVMGDSMSFKKKSTQIETFGFAHLSADCDCNQLFEANQSIETISIRTLYDINETAKANSEVSNLFVAHSSDSYEPENLYLTLDELYPKINNQTKTANYQEFNLFLTEPVLNDKAQFIINVKLSDDRVLSDTTNLITIINLK